MATPNSMTLLAIENWTALGKSVNFFTLTEKLTSSTSYTITDFTSGLSLTVGGTGFTTEVFNFFGIQYTVLATGTINSFTLSLHGKPIVQGSGYALPVPTFLSALEKSVIEGTALPLFDVWFSVKNTISGTALNENVLNTISGGFSISDSSANVQAGLALLEADAAHINSIRRREPREPLARVRQHQGDRDNERSGDGVGREFQDLRPPRGTATSSPLTTSRAPLGTRSLAAGRARISSSARSSGARRWSTFISI
jgi:hypothetical protein